MQTLYERDIVHPLESSDPESDSDSDHTLEDFSPHEWTFGHPLQRMARFDTLGQTGSPESSNSRCSTCSSDSEVSATSSVVFNIDYEALVDELLAEDPFPLSKFQNMVMVGPSTNEAKNPIMVKCLKRTSAELYILLELNHADLRHDPWNPAPHILCAVERNDFVFLCMEPLIEYNQPPFKTVADYIDFFKQTLEGLTFLHEHSIAQLCCGNPRSIKVDIGTGACSASIERFDRAIYPVRYYFTDFSQAAQFDSHREAAAPFRNDVKECGMMMDSLLVDIPRVAPKLKSLVKAMVSGHFGADDARKLFEALCKSLEASVFNIQVLSSTSASGLGSVSSFT